MKKKIEAYNNSNDNNPTKNEMKVSKSFNINNSHEIKLIFDFNKYETSIQCNSNDKIGDAIHKFEIECFKKIHLFSSEEFSNSYYIHNFKRLINMDVTIENYGLKNNYGILVIDTNHIIYC